MGVRLVVRSTWSSEKTSEHSYEFDQPRIVIGRHRGSDVHIPHPAVSGTHATLRAEGARWVVVDEGSTNGTKVSGERLPPGRPKPLSEGDVVDVGGFSLRLEQRPVVTATSVEGTAALARRIVEETLHQGGDESSATIRVLNGPEQGREVSIPAPPGRLVLGRGDDADLTLADEDLSRSHAEIARDLSGVMLRDLGSKNGTFLGDEAIEKRRLRDGDEIRLGKTVLLFEDAAARHLSEICSAPEQSMELPTPPEEPEPEPEAEAADDSVAEAAPPPSRAPARRRAALGADVFIYVLAGAVLALSIAGLFFLLRAG
jgi:pSer/pThr/pTyr-binding forkhead associated (FHA) protein